MPSIAFGQSTWLSEIFDRIEKRIADVTGIPRIRVFTYFGDASELLESPPAERFVAVGFDDLATEGELLVGSGPSNSGFGTTVSLDVFGRIGTDRELSDSQLLRDRSFGFAGILRKVCVAVQGWAAVEDGKSVFREPTRVLGVRLNPRKPRLGWTWARVRTNVRFIADLSGN